MKWPRINQLVERIKKSLAGILLRQDFWDNLRKDFNSFERYGYRSLFVVGIRGLFYFSVADDHIPCF
jgi:hypothetical protein